MAFVVSDDVDDLSVSEELSAEGFSKGLSVDLIAFEFKDDGLRGASGGLEHSLLGFARFPLGLVFISDDKGFIAIFLKRLLSENDVWENLDDGDGVHRAVGGEDLGHANLSSNK